MKSWNPFFVGVFCFLLSVGAGMMGCGDDDGERVTVNLEQLCAESLQAMESQACRETAYAGVDELKDCALACGPADEGCLEDNCFSAPGEGFSGCSGDVEFLFSGECGDCYTECGFDFVGDESAPGCLFDSTPASTGEHCLDELYACVEAC